MFTRLSKSDLFIIAICFVGIVVGTLLFFTNLDSRTGRSSERHLGYVRPAFGDVRVRGGQEMAWSRISRDADVFANDRVFTGFASTAQVRMETGHTVTMEPNSLIVISDPHDKNLNIDYGSFLVKLGKGQELGIRAPAGRMKINSEGAVFRVIASAEQKLQIVVLEGKTLIQANDQNEATSVEANQEAFIDSNSVQVETSRLLLQSPAPGVSLWNAERPQQFQWAQVDGTTNLPARIELAQDPAFTHILTQETSESGSAQILLKPGTYFWRVSSLADAAFRSSVSSFSVHAWAAPEIHSDSKIQVDLNEKREVARPLKFGWVDPSLSTAYRVELSSTPDFSLVEVSRETPKTEIEVAGLREGVYFWRVASIHPERAELLSIVGRLELVSSAKPANLEALPEASPPPPPSLELPTASPDTFLSNTPLPLSEPALTATPPLKPLATPAAATQALAAKPVEKRAPFARLGLWTGVGANYIKFSQDGSSGGGDSGSFAKISAPTLMLGMNYGFTPNSSIDLQIHDRPSSVKADSSLRLDKTDFRWQSYSAEHQYRFFNGGRSSLSSLVGVQIHRTPFLFVNSNGTTSLLENEFQNLSLGGKYGYLSDSNLQYEVFVRYQSILGSKSLNGSDFSARSSTMFDGSLGVSKLMPSGWKFGIYWFGQSQSLQYDFIRDETKSSGKQSFFDSNLQIRFGYDFFGLIVIPLFRRRKKQV